MRLSARCEDTRLVHDERAQLKEARSRLERFREEVREIVVRGGLGGGAGGTELGSVKAGGSCRGPGWWRKVSVRRRLKLEM